MIDIGRFKLGDDVAFPLVIPGASSVTATIYQTNGTVVETITLAPVAPSVFSGKTKLGRDYALGKFLVVYRFQVSGVSGLDVAQFTVVGGGDAGGSVISLYSHDRPEARYVIGQLSGGSLVQGRDPHF